MIAGDVYTVQLEDREGGKFVKSFRWLLVMLSSVAGGFWDSASLQNVVIRRVEDGRPAMSMKAGDPLAAADLTG